MVDDDDNVVVAVDVGAADSDDADDDDDNGHDGDDHQCRPQVIQILLFTRCGSSCLRSGLTTPPKAAAS